MQFEVYETDLVKIEDYEKSIKSSNFEFRGENVYAVANMKVSSQAKNETSKKVFKAKAFMAGFKYKNGKITDQDGVVVSRRFNKHISDLEFSSSSTYLRGEIIKLRHKRFVRFTIFREIKKTPTERTYTKDDLLSIDNGHNGVGYCISHSELTRRLKTQALFAPDMEALTKVENIDLLKALYLGKIIVIPGYKNTSEFTAAIGKDELGKILIHRRKTRFSWYELAKDWFSDTYINSSNIHMLQNFLDLGIHPIIYFEVDGKRVAHSVIVTDVEKSKRGYELNIIDPNRRSKHVDAKHGLVKNQYWFNPRTNELHTLNYGNVEIRLPKVDLSYFNRLNLVMHNEKLVKLALKAAKANNMFKFNIHDFN